LEEGLLLDFFPDAGINIPKITELGSYNLPE
jgi:hypothetical protein